jgi:hypothetical protein
MTPLYDYIGNALCFPIPGREEPGMIVTIDFDELAKSYEKLMKTSPYEKVSLVLTVLPLKPENVTDKKTHSVKLTNIIES